MNLEKKLLKIKYNTRYALFNEILQVCLEPKGINEIFYANPKKFTYSKLRTVIKQMQKLKIIEKTTRQKYQTTDKGEKFMKKFEELLALLTTEQNQKTI
jgi:predicted transcriptional regulator